MKSTDLVVGSSGRAVNRLHFLLNESGYEIPETERSLGFFGLATRDAVIAFQSNVGRPETGQLDDETIATLALIAARHRERGHDSVQNMFKPEAQPTTLLEDTEAKAFAESVLHRFSFKDAVERDAGLGYLISELGDAQKAIDHKLMVIAFYAQGGPMPGTAIEPVQFGGGSGFGFYRSFQNGIIYWRRDLGAFWVHGAILEKFVRLRSEAGILGYPISDETATFDKTGRFNHFEHGSIYWHPKIGAFEVHGAIRDKWLAGGAENFGYPTTDETGTPDSSGRFNHFRDVRNEVETSIYFTVATGAHVVHGLIRKRWAELGWERSFLGYPTGDLEGWSEVETGNTGLMTRFERGKLLWKAEDQNVVEVPDQFTLNSGHVGVSSVGGSVDFTLTSAGTFTYNGHFHNSGLVGLGGTVATVVKVGSLEIGLMVKKDLYMGGTLSFSDRNDDFSDSGYDLQIRDNWELLRQSHSVATRITINETDPEAFFALVFLPLLALGTIVTLTFKSSPPDTTCKQGELHTVQDGNNRTVVEPSWTSCGSWY